MGACEVNCGVRLGVSPLTHADLICSVVIFCVGDNGDLQVRTASAFSSATKPGLRN